MLADTPAFARPRWDSAVRGACVNSRESSDYNSGTRDDGSMLSSSGELSGVSHPDLAAQLTKPGTLVNLTDALSSLNGSFNAEVALCARIVRDLLLIDLAHQPLQRFRVAKEHANAVRLWCHHPQDFNEMRLVLFVDDTSYALECRASRRRLRERVC